MAKYIKKLRKTKGVTCLPEVVSVTLPTSCEGCFEATEMVKSFMAEAFKGYTATRADGCWWDSENREMVCEPVEVVESGHACMSPAEQDLFVNMIIEAGRMMDQSSMAIKTSRYLLIGKEAYDKYK